MPAPRLLIAASLAVVLAMAATALALGPAGAAGPEPGSSAQAFAVEIVAPGSDPFSAPAVSAPPDASTQQDSFSFEGVATGSIAAAATAQPGPGGRATASADVSGLSIFGGEITADAAARARASAGPQGATGDLDGSAVTSLVVLGQPVEPAPSLRVALGDWGYLVVLAEEGDESAPNGLLGHRGSVTALDVHLTADHGGLPAGSEILVGHAEAASTAPVTTTTGSSTGTSTSTTATTTTATSTTATSTTATSTTATSTSGTTTTVPATTRAAPPLGIERSGRLPGPGKQPKPKKKKKHGPRPLKATPRLAAGPYDFPVYGSVSYGDTYGAARSDIASGWHHGDDLFGQLGQPVLAVASGTVFSVGWEKLGGNRLWLRDRRGNQFYYAHLAAYAARTVDGAHVRAGDVLGFMGNTGDADTTPYHLHFEIHPVSLLFHHYDGAVDPTTYLGKWHRVTGVDFPPGGTWVPALHGGPRAPEPGAILLQVSDISRAAGLDPASLRRALARPPGP